MGIVITFFSLYLFIYRIKCKQDVTDRKRLILGLIIVILFSFVLNWYLSDVMKWEYGIPGADLRNYFDAAKTLGNGASLSDLSKISTVFELKFSNIGYLSYVIFIFCTAFSPIVFSIDISLRLIYFVQAIVAVLSCDNISSFFSKNDKIQGTLFWMLLLNAGILQQSSILMRDIWIVFFISLLFKECDKKEPSILLCFVYVLLSAILRSYSLLITFPVFLAYGLRNKKLAIIATIIIFFVFFIGTYILEFIASRIGILWNYDKNNYDLGRMLTFILYPNPITQAEIIVSKSEFHYHAVVGGNCAWVYFLLSIWNMIVLPVAFYGIFTCLKKRKLNENEIFYTSDMFVWLILGCCIILLYAFFYDSVSEPRHKLMLLYSTCFFYMKGVENFSLIKKVAIIWGALVLALLILLVV